MRLERNQFVVSPTMIKRRVMTGALGRWADGTGIDYMTIVALAGAPVNSHDHTHGPLTGEGRP